MWMCLAFTASHPLHFTPFYLILYGVTVQSVGGMQAATRSESTRSNSLQRESREASVSCSCCFFLLLLLFLTKIVVIPSSRLAKILSHLLIHVIADWSIITWFFTSLVGGHQGDISLPVLDICTALGTCLTPLKFRFFFKIDTTAQEKVFLGNWRQF